MSEAERLFDEARQRYQNVSPFPIAMLDFRRGLMWFEHGDLDAARSWFNAARRRVPSLRSGAGHLAEVDAALGRAQRRLPDCARWRCRPTIPNMPGCSPVS